MTSGEHAHVETNHRTRHNVELVRDVRTARNHKGTLDKHLHVVKGIDLLAQPQKILIGRQISTQQRKQFLNRALQQ